MFASHSLKPLWGVALVCGLLSSACSDKTTDPGEPPVQWECQIPSGTQSTEFLNQVGCTEDFQALASEPIDSNLPGARSVKVILDQADSNALYFQNSVLYQIHYQFASTHLSGNGKPIVPQLATFNATEYYSPERRFVLGAVTYYEGPGIWALEISPYDTASAAMITTLYETVKKSAFFGSELVFHPTSAAVEVEAARLSGIPIKTTDELYAAIDYQPLSLGSGVGRLRFSTVAELEDQYLSYEDIVVLDEAPNDISVVQGLITQEFQTPLSHVNVLSQNRHTPNMGLRGAMTNTQLRALEGKLVQLTVGSSGWTIREATQEEAEAFWAAHKPPPVTLPALNLSVKDIVHIEDVTPETPNGSLREDIKKAVLAYGGKAAHYSILFKTDAIPIRKAFAIPVYYYDQFMRENGFYDQLDAMLADPAFKTDPQVRDDKLNAFRDAMKSAPMNTEFQAILKDWIAREFAPGAKVRFRTSTNSEDLEGFPCAGCYDSHTGDPADWEDVLGAIRKTYASAWQFRSFEERSYYGVDHKSVGMALLVHQNFPDEEANGVATTSNPFDSTGLDPAFYVNVQFGGDAEVVAPPPGVTSDQILYFFNEPNQPVTYMTHSNLVQDGTTVLSAAQVHQLGVALDAIHKRFSAAYGPAAGNNGWYAMDVEFKYDNDEAPSQPATLYIKQARPYPGRGQ
ncbi:PEP/pyruvate-binding domain-containing protein [Hyalangium versicolor]|uniref:PEP/pyruvate-binding domain-containing protein n=1 Tax=Hyalangium versicolor TaxID=2861190 RepID=UPI001CCF2933|nr:PEP/pyruvate-binding domain-containing protein [Hyalangium versicolor]